MYLLKRLTGWPSFVLLILSVVFAVMPHLWLCPLTQIPLLGWHSRSAALTLRTTLKNQSSIAVPIAGGMHLMDASTSGCFLAWHVSVSSHPVWEDIIDLLMSLCTLLVWAAFRDFRVKQLVWQLESRPAFLCALCTVSGTLALGWSEAPTHLFNVFVCPWVQTSIWDFSLSAFFVALVFL